MTSIMLPKTGAPEKAERPSAAFQPTELRRRARRARLALGALAVAALCALLFSATAGASDVSTFGFLTRLLTADPALDMRDRAIILDIRLPRVLMGFMVGASLAVSGAVMQGLFRNPLADPGLTGVSAGASLGAVSIIVLGHSLAAPLVHLLGPFALPLAAFAGGLASTWLLYTIATHQGQTSVAVLLLAGIALSTLAAALTGFFIFMADDQQLRDLTFWGMGSLAGSDWTKLLAATPIMLPGLAAAPFLARGLNALALGEASAFHMGVSVQRLKRWAIASVAAATGASVAISGGIGFIGIIAPHLVRLVIGPDHRSLLPASALLGGTLLVLADAAARTWVAPAELPIGILTATAGGPFFLWILIRNRGRLAL
jgi:iron complex transport system permease protein